MAQAGPRSYDDTVSEIEGATQQVVRTFNVGDEPTGITYGGGQRLRDQ